MTPSPKLERILDLLRSMESVAVAYSGGVDSTLLAKAAQVALGDRAIAVTVRSPVLPAFELDDAVAVARLIGIRHQVVDGPEMDDPQFVSNPVNRCYFCKAVRFRALRTLAEGMGFRHLVHGEVADDENDFRPGAQAARELGVRAPLQEVGLTKAEGRELSRQWGLPTWDRPSSPCLATRIPCGVPITEEKLRVIEAAEALVRQAGFRQLRVRHHGDIARVELPVEDLARVTGDEQLRLRLVDGIGRLGFRFVTLDLTGFRSGSMNG